MQKMANKLATLREKHAQILARISRLENLEKKQTRKDDTRLKVIVGAAMLADAQLYPETARFIRTVLARSIRAERDQEFLISKNWL